MLIVDCKPRESDRITRNANLIPASKDLSYKIFFFLLYLLKFTTADFAGDMASKTQDSYRRFIYGLLSRYQSQVPKMDIAETGRVDERKDASSKRAVGNKNGHPNSEISRPSSSDDEELSDRKWRLEHLEWLSKALEPALQLCRWALPVTGLLMSCFFCSFTS